MNSRVFSWRVVQGSDLLLKHWGTELIVYNSLSGETHQIDDFSATVLEQVMSNHCTEEKLLKDVSSLYPLENNSRIKQLLAQVINNFDQIGLIEPHY